MATATELAVVSAVDRLYLYGEDEDDPVDMEMGTGDFYNDATMDAAAHNNAVNISRDSTMPLAEDRTTDISDAATRRYFPSAAVVGATSTTISSASPSTGSTSHAAHLTWDDIKVGELVGSGSFASVYRVNLRPNALLRAIEAQTNGPNRAISSAMEELLIERNEADITYRGSSRCYSSTLTSSTTFALKRLSAVILARNEKGDTSARIAYQGMKFEARLLSQLLPPHPHIVRIYGMTGDLYERPDTGFIVLEYLSETLEERLHRWRTLKAMEKESMTVIASCQRFFDRRRGLGPEQRFRIKRIGLGIADALQYLHEHRVLYRDLKPANIGFDDAGAVRLYDFDLSRFLRPQDEGKNLTACIGSLRYMSPECARGLQYGLPSDIHSYCILLWEICTLQRPFHNVNTTPQLVKVAFIGTERPSLRKVASSEIKTLLQSGWNPNPEARPVASDVVQQILASLVVKGRKRCK